MNKKLFLFTVNIISIICTFFLGYYFEKNYHIDKLNEIKNKKYYINLKKTDKKIEIQNPYDNIKIIVNSKELNGNSVELEK